MTVTSPEQEILDGLDWEHVEPCAANQESCKHEAAAIMRFMACATHPNLRWYTACQGHLDKANAGRVRCASCQSRLVILDVKYL